MVTQSTPATNQPGDRSHPRVSLIVQVLVLIALLGAPGANAEALDYQIVWSDEFNGTAVDPAKWEFQTGDGCPNLCGWGNNELQYYRSQNATVSGGLLTIAAKAERFGGRDYTSARMRTRNRGEWTYGRIEMRAKMPIGRGLWPAFWMLPTDQVYGGWAASGEIDIVEYVGQTPDRSLAAIHYGGSWPANTSWSSTFTLPPGSSSYHDSFHDFALEWGPRELRWYVDGNRVACQSHWYSTAGPYPAPFDEDFHLLLNMAVGGNLPGPPDASTQFPQQYVIDHVRVLQRPEFPQCESLFAGMDDANPLGNGWFRFDGGGNGGIGANTSDLPAEGCNASLNASWSSGGSPGFLGGFGRRFPLDLSQRNHFTFWINPDAGQDYTIEINLQDDDDGNNAIADPPNGADDEFQFECAIGPSGPCAIAGGGWQRISIPLADFYDDNSYHYGGNGVLDPVPTSRGGNGQLINVVLSLISDSGANVSFRTDTWVFTREEGSIDGRVWDDTDGDGVRDAGEPGLGGVAVDLLGSGAALVETTTTIGDGTYRFATLPWDEYTVSVRSETLPPGRSPTSDPDGPASPHAAASLLGCGDAIVANDFGYGVAPRPPASTVSLSKRTGDPGRLDVAYDASTCNASDHAVLYGLLGDFATVVAADCSIGNGGSFTSTPPSGNVWLLVAGREGARYSSVGSSTAGERPLDGVDAACPALVAQDVSASCP